MSGLSETLESGRGRWVQPTTIKIYCPRDKNVSCIRSGCVTFDNVVVINRNPGRRSTVEVISPLSGDNESCLWVPCKDFELAVSETRAISLGMFIATNSEVHRKRIFQFEIRFGPSEQVRQRHPRLQTIHSEIVRFMLVDVDDGTYPMNIVHACFRNLKHDKLCRLQGLDANERQTLVEDESESSLGESVEIIEPDLDEASEQGVHDEPERKVEGCLAEGTLNTDGTPIRTNSGHDSTSGRGLVQFRMRGVLILVISLFFLVALHLIYVGLQSISVGNHFDMMLNMAYVRIAELSCKICRKYLMRAMDRKQLGYRGK